MTHKNNKARLFFTSACIMALSACSAPNFFPDGYTHHNKPYKSQDPPLSPKFTKEQRAAMGPEQADQYRLAVYTLVDRLTERAGMPPKAVYVVRPDKMTALHSHIDNDLRESLRHIGYRLSDAPDNSYAFAYSAVVIKDWEGRPVADDGATPNVRLALYVFDGMGESARLLTQEIGDFYIRGAEVSNLPQTNFPGIALPGLNDRTGRGSE
ncbi:MAG: hypothetical protein WC989_07290 [Micavibrio sp.]